MRRGVAVTVLLLALTPSAYLAWQARDMPQLGYAHDDTMYWVAAKSLAEGGGYRISSLPAAPYQTKYPPLVPLFYSMVWRAAPEYPANLRWAALVAWLLAAAYVGASYLLLRGLVRDAALLAVFVALSPWVALSGISLLSEVPFSILAFMALALAARAGRQEAPWWLAAAAGAVAGAAYLTRPAGVVLLVACPLALALGRRPKRALLFAAAMLPAIAGWALWTHAHRSPPTDPLTIYYTDYLGYYMRDLSLKDLPLAVWHNLDSLASAAGSLFIFGLGDGAVGKTVARVLAAAAVAGLVRLGRRGGWTGAHFFAAAYLALLLVWDFPSDQRFLIPVLPILLAGLWTELRNLAAVTAAAWHGALAGRSAAAVAAALLIAGALAAARGTAEAYTSALPKFVEDRHAAAAASLPVYRWIAANLPADARLLAFTDVTVYLSTGRRACRFFVAPNIVYRQDRAALDAALASATPLARALRLSYAVVTPSDPEFEFAGERRAAGDWLVSANPAWRRVWGTGHAAVYHIE